MRPSDCRVFLTRLGEADRQVLFDLYALDMKLDAQPAAEAFETRMNLMKAKGHILGKPSIQD